MEAKRVEMRMIKIALTILLAMPGPAWASEAFTDDKGCYTTRKWETRCQANANPVTNEVIIAAKARAKEKTLDTYKAMEQAKAKAKESPPATDDDLKQALIRAKSKATSRDPGAYKRAKAHQGA